MNKSIEKQKTGVSAKLKSFTRFAYIQAFMLATALSFTHRVLAAGSDPGAAKWDAIIGFILPWIGRLGGVVILIGAVEFGLAWKQDDAEGKTKGMRTVIAGCIVTAVGLSAPLFLN